LGGTGVSKIQSKSKKSGKIGKVLSKLGFIITAAILGFFGGYSLDAFLGAFTKQYVQNDSIFVKVFVLIILLSVFVILYLLQILIHEAGHLIFGLMTGYTFVSFRVASFIIIKEEGRLKLMRYNIPGTGGQCLLMPPEMSNGQFPFLIYNLGGVLVNLIVSIVSILIIIFAKGLPFPVHTVLILFSIAGIFAVLTNSIPMKIGGISNDAHNIVSMIRDENARIGFHTQLRVNGLQSQGMRIKDIPLETFYIDPDADLSSPLNTSMKLMEHTWYLDNCDFEMAQEVLDALVPYTKDVIELYKYEINMERIFLELIGDCNKKFIDNLYDKNIRKYIKSAKHMIDKKRFLMAYQAFYNDNKDRAIKHYKEIQEMADNYPIKGGAEMELMLAGNIRDMLNREEV